MKSCSITLLESLRIPATISQASHNLFQTVGTSTGMNTSSRNQHGNLLCSGIFLWLHHTSLEVTFSLTSYVKHFTLNKHLKRKVNGIPLSKYI